MKGHKPAALDAGTESAAAWWWEYARLTAHRLRDGLPPGPWDLSGTGIVLGYKEIPYVGGDVSYRRYREGQGGYEPMPVMAVGTPSFVLGSIAGTAIGNARSRRAARRAAQPGWRDHQRCTVIATSNGIRCRTGLYASTTIPYSAVSEFHPAPSDWTLTLGFGDIDNPLRITGFVVPTISLVAAHRLGWDWHADPKFAPLIGARDSSLSTAEPPTDVT